MKTYDDEYNELVAWCKKEVTNAKEKIAQLPKIEGRDDRAVPIENAVWQEWNRRLVQLKIKYDKDLTLQERAIKEKFKLRNK